jgi:phosphatidylglycerophosphatase A
MSQRASSLARELATGFRLGERLPAAGTTAGSLPAAVAWWGACQVLPSTTLRLIATALAMVAAAIVGVWAAEAEVRRLQNSDPQSIVIDEVAGQWLTYLVAMPFIAPLPAGPLVIFAAVGFGLFRFFDIVKPWPLRRLEQLPGGLGVMADDLAAGYYAAIVLVAAWKILG